MTYWQAIIGLDNGWAIISLANGLLSVRHQAII